MSQAEHVSTTRRSLLAEAAAVGTILTGAAVGLAGLASASPLSSAHPEVTLIELGEEAVRLGQVFKALEDESRGQWDEAFGSVQRPEECRSFDEHKLWLRNLEAAQKDTGFTDLWARCNEAEKAFDRVAEVLRVSPALTLEGLCAKARLVAFDCTFAQIIVADLLAIHEAAQV